MTMQGRIPSRPLTILALLAAALGACSGDGAGLGSTSIDSMFAGRPRVGVSAAEVHPGSGVDQLDFFDALEKRDLVSYDDALHSTLLLFAGQSGQTYAQRAGRAKIMGILDASFDRPPREAITAGELARIVAAGLKRPSAASESAALDDLKQLHLFPDATQDNSGVSGPQLLTILGHAEDAMALAAPAPAALRPLTPQEQARTSAAVFSFQPTPPAGSPPGDRRPVKKPPIDLDKDARKPRPGQVLPGGTPASTETPPPAPAPTSPPPATTPPPSPAPERPTPPPTPAPAPSPAPAPAMSPARSTPLPPPRAGGATVSRIDGVASDLRYVAVDRVAVHVDEVVGPGEFVQWRPVESDEPGGRPGPWRTLQPGESINDRIEIRTGLGVRAVIRVNDAVVVVHRLSRVRLERKIRSDAEAQVGVTMYRGLLEVSGGDSKDTDRAHASVVTRTPDQVFPVRANTLFEYDAFAGTIAREVER